MRAVTRAPSPRSMVTRLSGPMFSLAKSGALMELIAPAAVSERCSGRTPSVSFELFASALPIASVMGRPAMVSPSPLSASCPSACVPSTSTRFIGGLPTKLATKVVAGRR
ncbi:hypothetical protein D3C87_1926450 [compost metagenome]